jgi:hypothetical protein
LGYYDNNDIDIYNLNYTVKVRQTNVCPSGSQTRIYSIKFDQFGSQAYSCLTDKLIKVNIFNGPILTINYMNTIYGVLFDLKNRLWVSERGKLLIHSN